MIRVYMARVYYDEMMREERKYVVSPGNKSSAHIECKEGTRGNIASHTTFLGFFRAFTWLNFLVNFNHTGTETAAIVVLCKKL